MDVETPVERGSRRSPSLAALLSFVWPGLGHLYLGKRRWAAIFAVPLLVLALLVGYEVAVQGPLVFATRIATVRAFGLGAVALVLLVGGWRLVSLIHAYTGAAQPRAHKIAGRVGVGALIALIAFTHGAAGFYMLLASNAVDQTFTGNNSLIDMSTPTPSLAPGQTAGPTPTLVQVTPPPIGSRVTILFTGVDAAQNRSERLYDSIMVVSFDPKTNSVQMVSVPRDTASFPLYYGGQAKISTKINTLPTRVAHGWENSPDPPYMTLVKEIGYLVGIPINYYAVMDFGGFQKMIDMVGGIDINNPSPINDPNYDWLDGHRGFTLATGPAHLDGRHALAYVRSRHGSGNSDWKRASRQQEVMVALLHRMADPTSLLVLPSVIETLGSSVSTNFPADSVADYVSIGLNIPNGNFKQIVLDPPDYMILTGKGDCLINYKVAQLSIQLFGKDSTYYGKKAPANTCPVTPTATPSPAAPAPTPSPSAT